MNKTKLLGELKKNPRNVSFKRLCNIAIAFGFRYRGGKGSHSIYVRDGVNELMNFQNVHGKAKPYQVKQFIKIVEKYNLTKEEKQDV